MEATGYGHRQEEQFHRNVRFSPEELFNLFVEATDCQEILQIFQNVRNILQINENGHKEVYSKIKSKLTSWKCQSLWDLIDCKAKHVEYGKGAICSHVNVLIIGAGPIGLRTAIETALLGCRTVIVEKRKSFSRNNVLHLWPFLLTDFRSLGAKKFYGKFCAGAIDHIKNSCQEGIKRLQSILFKVCLILGVEIFTGVEFKGLIEPTNDKGWRAQCSPPPHVKQLDEFEFDVVVGADGKKDMLPGFPQIEMRGALAIGITCNFVNENTVAEAGVEEISGIAYQFNPKFFDDLREQFDVGLENIVYYKDETHYFVMTAMKSSLLKRGVFKQDFSDPTKLLEKQNVDLDQLIQYTLDTVHYATKYNLPTDIKLVQNPNGTPDIAVFDFTSLKKSASASKMMERKGKRLLMALVGDSLLQPFWPTGSGCGRGVLSALDAAWMIRLFGMKMSPLAVLRERENIFKLLPATDSSHLQKNYKAFTINPATRYSNLNQVASVNVAFLKKLYDTDDPENADYTLPEPVVSSRFEIGRAATVQHKARKKSLAKRRVHSTSSHKRRSDRTTLRDAKHVSNKMAMWEDKIPKNSQPGGPSKKTKPSHSGSGSCLESVSESEHEETAVGPYQRAMTLRNRKQSNDTLSDVFTGSSAEELDRMDDDDTHLLTEKQSSVQGSTSTVAHPEENATDHHQHGDGRKHHKGGVMRRILGRGRGDHDGERRKSVAARKSLSKARRMRRKSGAGSRSSQSQPEDKESTTLLPKDGHGSITVRKKHSKTRAIEDQESATFKVPAAPAEDKVKKSAKELIAAAEARHAKESKHGTKKNETLKRKADEIGEDTKSTRYENVPWNHHLPAVEPLLPPENNKENQEHSVKRASQLAGLVSLAVPLLLPCRVRLVGKHSSMLAEKRNTLLRSSTEKKETRKISLTRAGSVQKAVAQYKTKLEQDTSSDFAEFKRNRHSGRFNRDSFTGKISPYQGNSVDEPRTTSAGSAVDTDDYDIIEMKSSSLQAKEVIDLSVIDEEESAKHTFIIVRLTKKILNTVICCIISLILMLVVVMVSVHFIFV